MDQRFAYAATEYAAQIVNLVAQNPSANKDVLIRLGELVYDNTYRHTDDDIEVVNLLRDVALAALGAPGELLRAALSHGATAEMILGSARWADQAYPQVQLGHKYAASLAITTVHDPDVIAMIRPPWKAFLIEIPRDLFFAHDDSMPNGLATVTRVLVRYFENPQAAGGWAWGINVFTDGGVTFWRVQNTTDLLAVDSEYLQTAEDDPFTLDASDLDQRTMIAISRLVLNVCLKFLDRTAKPIGRAKSASGTRSKGARIEPQVRVFEIGQPVVLDVRQAVKDYILHGPSRKGRSPQVQTLVRGHWKPILGARLGHPVWIEPHWRGKEGAPILITPKIIKNPSGGSDPYGYW